MSTGLNPLTELEAVNEILGTATESPVSTLESDEVVDATLALDILRNTSKEIQTRGWWFNTADGFTIVRDQSNRVNMPLNTLKATPSGDSAGILVSIRDNKLYDVVNRTDEFASDVTVDMTLGLDFEDLPSSARIYITIRAARKYQDRYVSDDSLHAYTLADERDARVLLLDEDIEAEKPNMLNSAFAQNLLSRA